MSELQVVEASTNKNLQVVQSNLLVNSFYNISNYENKVLLAAISQIKISDQKLCWHKFTTDQLCELCNIERKYAKETLMSVKDSLFDKKFKLSNEIVEIDGKKMEFEGEYRFIDGIRYNDNIWLIKLSDFLIPFVLNLKSNFTSKELSSLTKYSTAVGIRFDLIFTMEYKKAVSRMPLKKKMEYCLVKYIPLEELKKMFLLENKYNNNFNRFKTVIIDTMLEDMRIINNYQVTVEYVKKGKKVIGVKFYVKLGENNPFLQELQTSLEQKENNETIIKTVLCKKFKFSVDEANDIYTNHHAELKNIFSKIKQENISDEDGRNLIISLLCENTPSEIDEFWDNL